MKVSHRLTRLATAGALAAPAAHAVPAAPDRQPADRIVVAPAPTPVVQSVDDGFDWASAAIGTGAAGGLILLSGAGGTSYRHRHGHIGIAR